MQPLFLKPVFQERIWGGNLLNKEYGYEIPSDKTGECWAISAHPNGASTVSNGKFEGMTLAEIWEKYPEVFGNPTEKVFPLLTKILDASDDLSVQVHPDDEYAFKNENGELGKTECWYVLSCEEGAELVFGHHAQTKEEFVDRIEKGEWNELLQKVKVKAGDFLHVPAGAIHGIGAGIMILETQQSSDTTYRVYDYDRRDDQGNLRELHVEKSIAVSTVPHMSEQKSPVIETREGVKSTTYVEDKYFTVYKWEVNGNAEFSFDDKYLLASVLDGSGTLENNGTSFEFKKGDHFIIPVGFGEFQIKGECELMISHV